MSVVTHPTGAHVPPADRGHVVVAAKVIEKTAVWVAARVPGIGAPLGSVRGGRANFDSAPKIAVHLDGPRAYLEVEAAVEYPRPLGPTTQALRQRLIHEVGAMTGVRVSRVDIRVTRVIKPPHQPRSVE